MELKYLFKPNPLVPVFFVISLLFLLVMPFKLIQMICIALIFLILISFCYAKILQHSITVERELSELKLACKEHARINFTIRNNSRLTAHICYYFDEAAYLFVFKDENSGLIQLRPRELYKVSYEISAQDRGLYHAGPVRIRTFDPLGLYTIEMQLPEVVNIMVRPARIKLITEAMPGFPQGNLKIQNHIYEDITMRRSIREYENGDEQKRINWRLSAKYGHLYTNQYDDSYDAPFFVFLNLAADDYSIRNRSYYTEKAVEIAAAIVEKSRRLKQRCGFAAYGTGFPYISPRVNQADCILDLLSLIKPVEGKLDYDPLIKFKHQLPAGTLLFVIGPAEVDYYYAKVEANKENITASSLGIVKKQKMGTDA